MPIIQSHRNFFKGTIPAVRPVMDPSHIGSGTEYPIGFTLAEYAELYWRMVVLRKTPVTLLGEGTIEIGGGSQPLITAGFEFSNYGDTAIDNPLYYNGVAATEIEAFPHPFDTDSPEDGAQPFLDRVNTDYASPSILLTLPSGWEIGGSGTYEVTFIDSLSGNNIYTKGHPTLYDRDTGLYYPYVSVMGVFFGNSGASMIAENSSTSESITFDINLSIGTIPAHPLPSALEKQFDGAMFIQKPLPFFINLEAGSFADPLLVHGAVYTSGTYSIACNFIGENYFAYDPGDGDGSYWDTTTGAKIRY